MTAHVSATIDRMLGLSRRAADVALVAVIVLVFGAAVLGRIVPALGHPVFIVAGPSMEPAIPIGSVVILTEVDATALAVGDVVSLRSGPGQAIFTHRIIRLVDRDGAVWLETRGDANATADPSLTDADAVIGRVTISVPLAGYLLTLASAPVGFAFALLLGAALFTLGWLLDDILAARRRRRIRATAPPGSRRRRVAGHPSARVGPATSA